MNGDNREEAHRPRPLSAGIWTLFSWLRRSEQSSSSESLSSVGSARTAVSFDFLVPGTCDITNNPIVLTTPLNPPSETYKKRLQDRNLRRQRDRGITLHRKYGLFREHGSGYEGFSLPPAKRTLVNSVDRPNRERRATSECLQRRAAYVPGKRRAPLPPTIASSVSLPRTYKRKRAAPKPPIKIEVKESNNIVQLLNNPLRMNSNPELDLNLILDNNLLSNRNNERKDKKEIDSGDIKTKTDKNFLKHIFENRKRNSMIEKTSVRLLPSISELDKQAAEIIQNNKLLQNKNNSDNFNDKSILYEGNVWFCTSCLRKYNSSVESCNYCLHNTNNYLNRKDLKSLSSRSSIYTQTNSKAETAIPSQSCIDERKILKEILKEMKDSLPKKINDNKVNNIITEIPTLRIGSTVQESHKDLICQPSSSREICNIKNEKKSVSSVRKTNFDNQKSINDNHLLTNSKSNLIANNIIQHKEVLAFECKDNNSSSKNNECLEKHKIGSCSQILLSGKTKTDHGSPPDTCITKLKNDNHIETTPLNGSDKLMNASNTQTQSISNKNKYGIAMKKNKPPQSHGTENDLLHHSHNFLNNRIQLHITEDDPNKALPVSPLTFISNKCEKKDQNQSKIEFLNLTNSHAVVVNTVTIVTSHSNNTNSPILKNISGIKTENNSAQTSKSKIQNEKNITDLELSLQSKTNLETKITPAKTKMDFKSEYDLHTPLKISSLLNPMYSSKNTFDNENKISRPDSSKQITELLHTNCNDLKGTNNDVALTKKYNKENKKVAPIDSITCELKSKNQVNDLKETVHTTVNLKQFIKNEVPKNIPYEQKSLPSTSGCFSSKIVNSNETLDNLDHYDRRRHFINQLEQSIAKGDEVAAAEAAVKLAKLRLSCSVLSFSSQIIGESSNDEQDVSVTSTSSQANHGVPQALKAERMEPLGITTQLLKTKLDKDLAESKVCVTNNVTTELADTKPQLFTNVPSSSPTAADDIVPVNVWIEDKQAARGPILLRISRRATMADLQRQAEDSLGLASQLQRWIIGRTLCNDDAVTIASLAGPDLRAPFYLCIVQPDENHNTPVNLNNGEVNGALINKNNENKNGEFYRELMKLEKQSLVPNIELFECGVCMEECAVGDGVVLRECIHTFCRGCLSDVVQHCQEPAVPCPATGCAGFLQEREIRSIVTSEEYERWLARGLATAECGTRNAFHCRTRDCSGWAFYDPGVRRFPCPVCKKTNCVQCQAIHEDETCEQYQVKLRETVTAAETNKDDEGTQALLNSLISRGEALKCPECTAIITKKWGCDWVKCSACKTEICWVTKGKRWGPGGRGDTSGGCRCGVDGQRCHPSCGYCH